ncbi:hypothetical protein FHL06_04200 [Lactobacillus halodurans]|nr:hypothetical protein [Companilactobacillus halodurans]MQS75592.1 hypothetical protein [Companilactobacillus halodurans]
MNEQTKDSRLAAEDDEWLTEEEIANFEEGTWTEADSLRLSEGPILEHSDGTTTRPYLYFGDYVYASQNISLLDAYQKKGDSRQVSLTAANSAILFADKGSRISDGLRSPNNHIYTTHYGDNQNLDTGLYNLEIENRPYGSPNSFVSNTLYNTVQQTDNWLLPGTSGPDKAGYSFAFLERPRFFYRIDPNTGFEEQRLVFRQRAFDSEKKGRANPEVTTTIRQKFDKGGRIITIISSKNTGKTTINNFTAFSNQDFSLNKDGKEIISVDGKKAGNYLPMYSLGNNRGMYIQSKNDEVRTSIYTKESNYPPKAWAARSISHSYIATKGYMVTHGLLEIGRTTERYYPWKVGKPKGRVSLVGNNFYDRKTQTYKSPYVPENLYNAFDDQRDLGDAENNLTAGTRLGASRAESMWDTGLTMHSPTIDLEVGKSSKIQYTTKTDVNGKDFNPVLKIDDKGTDDKPNILILGQKDLPITGSWFDFDSTNATIYYTVDSMNPNDLQILANGVQTNNEAASGKVNEIKKSIPLRGLDKSKHRIRFIMKDGEGHLSTIEETIFRFIKDTTNQPQINVISPSSSYEDPHTPFSHQITLRGIWSDKDSKNIKSISYSIDDGEEKAIQENVPVKDNSRFAFWELQDLNIGSQNDFKPHKITFKIVDDEDNIGKEDFYFQHKSGSTQLIAPQKIDLGSLVISPISSKKIKPTIKEGKIILDDFRENSSHPINVTLSIARFYKSNKNQEETHHHSEDGDDSQSSHDPDTSTKALALETDKSKYISHKVYWKNKRVSSKNLIIGQSVKKDEKPWHFTNDFTNEVLKNLELTFKSVKNKSVFGEYVSQWTWQTIDSIE